VRMSALFGAKKSSDFSKFMVCPNGQGGGELNQCGHFVDKERGGSMFCDFVRTSFMYGPLSNRWPLQYGVLQQCVELVMTNGVARISE